MNCNVTTSNSDSCCLFLFLPFYSFCDVANKNGSKQFKITHYYVSCKMQYKHNRAQIEYIEHLTTTQKNSPFNSNILNLLKLNILCSCSYLNLISTSSRMSDVRNMHLIQKYALLLLRIWFKSNLITCNIHFL